MRRSEDGHPRCLKLQGGSYLPQQNACPEGPVQYHPLCSQRNKDIFIVRTAWRTKADSKSGAIMNMLQACALGFEAAQLRAPGTWHGLSQFFRHSRWSCGSYQEHESRQEKTGIAQETGSETGSEPCKPGARQAAKRLLLGKWQSGEGGVTSGHLLRI